MLGENPNDGDLDPLNTAFVELDVGVRAEAEVVGAFGGQYFALFAVDASASDFTLFWPGQPEIDLVVQP